MFPNFRAWSSNLLTVGMNMNVGGGFGAFAFLVVLWGLFVTIAWLVIGWRAMKAHEKIADAVQDYLKRKP